MHSLKHLFWVHHWQLVGSVHPPGGLVGLQERMNKKVYFIKKYFAVFLPVCASGPQNFGVNVLMPDCLCMLKHARVVPQRGPGQEPWSTATWQAVLALGWPLPPPGCPHSLTSLAWQQQPNKLRAPQSSHRSMGMFFTAPTPLFMVIMVCVVHKHTHMSNEIYQSWCPLRSLKKHTQACMYFTSSWLPPYPCKWWI